MDGQAFGLFVFLVPAEAEPAQAFKNGVERSLRVALDVGIVDTKDHGAAVMPGVQPVENEGTRTPDV
jgi:hypothetical protein